MHEHHCRCGHAFACPSTHQFPKRCPRCAADMVQVALGTPRPPLVKRPVTPQIMPTRQNAK